MTNKTGLSLIQVILLLFHCRLISEQVFQPAVSTPPANQDLWVAEILSLFYLFIICGPLLFLTGRFPTMTTVQYTEKIMGKLIGKLFGLAFVGLLLLYCQLELALAGVFLESLLLPETPKSVILLFMAVPCMYLCYKGLESIGRLAEIFVPLTFVIFNLFFFLSIKDMKLNVFLPVLADTDFSLIHYGALNLASRFCEILILGMLAPSINTQGHTTRLFVYTVIPMTLTLLISTISTQAVLGTTLASEASFPYYSFVRQISVLDFLERIESLNLFVWVCGWFLKFTLYLTLALRGLDQIFAVKSPLILLIPVVTMMYVLALKTPLVKSVVTEYLASYEVLPWITLGVIFIVPAITLAVYFLQRQSQQRSMES